MIVAVITNTLMTARREDGNSRRDSTVWRGAAAARGADARSAPQWCAKANFKLAYDMQAYNKPWVPRRDLRQANFSEIYRCDRR
jgi:hypothetical protein